MEVFILVIILLLIVYVLGIEEGERRAYESLPPQDGQVFIHRKNGAELEVVNFDKDFCVLKMEGGAILHMSSSDFIASYKRKLT